ncbi:hypothetical protein COT72_03605 [archaeon CG10_big_fil_rev_8_21_14_0_10_43_11]|nr:MAG: hypothetical protein COT72_03605 [archaeon CG10_big_fil_rev_8_21_14_0_10_43_11]
MRIFHALTISVSLALLLFALVLLFNTQYPVLDSALFQKTDTPTKLYWFIPDGMRAEPKLFTVYEWAQNGLLPNIKYLMDHGTYGYSIPTFPSHTPTNFATLLTGTLPELHGVADGPMHVEGAPLDKPSVKGFASTAKKIPSAWTLFEDAGKSVALLSVPGSTPPELSEGVTILGRWGGWGFENPALIFEPQSRADFRKSLGRGAKLFYLGQALTQFIPESEPTNWVFGFESFSPAKELALTAYGATIYALITDSTDDNTQNYDTLIASTDKQNRVTLLQGEWSEWTNITLAWNNFTYKSAFRIHPIFIKEDGTFRLRVFYDNFNPTVIDPQEAFEHVHEKTGPMVDFVDNFPPQLIYEKEDKQTFLDEAFFSLDWHKNAVGAIYDTLNPDVFIHDIYTPNQMLTGKWWMSAFVQGNTSERSDVLRMYQALDAIIGKALNNTDENTLFVLSSDHGAVELKRQVHLNNYFAQKGWLSFTINNQTGEPIIDWDKTRVIFLKMSNVYINPNGLGGNWQRASGPEYEALRNEVVHALYALEDEDGSKPAASVVRWEDAPRYLDLPQDRVGDLLLANIPGYGWYEEMDEKYTIFSTPLKTGYKQAIFAQEENGMWTPFIIMGKGISKNVSLDMPIRHQDQLPTILSAMGMDIPAYMQGYVINQAFADT